MNTNEYQRRRDRIEYNSTVLDETVLQLADKLDIAGEPTIYAICLDEDKDELVASVTGIGYIGDFFGVAAALGGGFSIESAAIIEEQGKSIEEYKTFVKIFLYSALSMDTTGLLLEAIKDAIKCYEKYPVYPPDHSDSPKLLS